MLVLTAVLFLSVTSGLAEELPNGFTKCSRSDPNLNACLIKSIDDTIKLLADGVPSLGIPPIEPFKVDNVALEQGGKNTRFSLKSNFTDVVMTGLTTSKMKRVLVKFDKPRIKSEIFTERLDMTADYMLNGQIAALPIVGQGRANISMHQPISTHDIKGEYFTKPEDNEIYFNVTSYQVKFKPKRVTFNFKNLFNGDKVLGDTMNQFMNQNWKAVFNGLVPEYEKFFGAMFKKIAKNVFDNIPVNQIFLE